MIRAGFLSCAERRALEACVCRQREDHGVARRANAILLLDDGKSCQAIAEFPYLDDDTIRGWHKTYQTGGWDALSTDGWKGRSVPHDVGSGDGALQVAALDFLRRHGGGLCDLLGLLTEEPAFDALCELHAQSGAVLPDACVVQRGLRQIHAALAAQETCAMDALSVRKGYCVDTSVRWYGARISDLLAAFR